VIIVDVSLAEPGMELLRDVKDGNRILARKDEKLTEETIEKLKSSDARFLLVKTRPDEKDPGTLFHRSRTTR